jgi:hypothetical protein
MGDLGYGVVLGVPRSGTTFLMRFLDAMPETEAVAGNLLPTVVPHLMNQELSPAVRDALLGAFPRSLRDYLESGAFNSRSAALRKWAAARHDLGGALAGRRQVARIVYKEPFLAFAPGYAYEALPAARIVYIVRDGRDVADSLVRSYDVLTDEKLADLGSTESPLGRRHGAIYVPWWVEQGREDEFAAATPYVRALWMWAAMAGRCRGFFSDAGVRASRRIFELKYEDLVSDPAEWGRRVAEHLGGGMTARMRKEAGEAHSRSIGVHRRRDAAELAAGTRVAGDELRAHGYAD